MEGDGIDWTHLALIRVRWPVFVHTAISVALRFRLFDVGFVDHFCQPQHFVVLVTIFMELS